MPANKEYDKDEVRARLEPWLADRFGEAVTITDLDAPGSSGFSSETMLIDCQVGGETGGRAERLVLRGEPMEFRVFPTYDLELQFKCMDAVRTHTDVPMPALKWFEAGSEVLGHPFYVMERIDGLVPTDNLPYTIDGFLYEAKPEQQEQLYRSAIRALAELHSMDVDASGLRFLDRPDEGPTGLEQQLAYYERYIPFAMDGESHPVLEDGFTWIMENRPTGIPEGLSWGDSRLGNMMFKDFEVAAVLDWEMAYLGPREQDVAWFFYFIRFFSDGIGLPNLPGFPAEEVGLAYYEELTGYRLQNMDWFMAWAAYRYAVILVRLLHRPGVMESSPDEWTLIDNPFVRGFTDLTGVPVPEA